MELIFSFKKKEQKKFHMKNILTLAIIVLLVLAVSIIYLGMQRESIFNPPNITGIGFLMIAIVLVFWRKEIQ